MTDLTLIEIVRLGISIVFVLFMVFVSFTLWRHSSNMQKLVQQGILDKEAREVAMLELRQTAITLAEKTQLALDRRDMQQEALGDKIDRNTELTIKAAEASATAAEVANSVNEKIADTNRRLFEMKP